MFSLLGRIYDFLSMDIVLSVKLEVSLVVSRMRRNILRCVCMSTILLLISRLILVLYSARSEVSEKCISRFVRVE